MVGGRSVAAQTVGGRAGPLGAHKRRQRGGREVCVRVVAAGVDPPLVDRHVELVDLVKGWGCMVG